MRPVGPKWWDSETPDVDEHHEGNVAPLEHELTMHLERAHLLGERMQRSTDAVQHDIDRAAEIADELLSAVLKEKGRAR
jgi:hypothetical protein